MRDLFVVECRVKFFADAHESVLIAARDPEQFKLFARVGRIFDECSTFFVFGADEKPPTQANVSRFARPKLSDCPPPIESPKTRALRGRLSRSTFFSM